MSMIYAKQHDTFLYHYTTSAKARVILENRTLKFGRFAGTNDPKEYQSWLFGVISSDANRLLSIDAVALSAKLSASLKNVARLACFCSDRGPLSGDNVKDILLRGFARARMWAQYGGAHKGVCLVFDKSQLIDRIRSHIPSARVFSEPVDYKNRGPFPETFTGHYSVNADKLSAMGYESYAEHFLEQNYRPLFFEKLLDWRDETEWRIVLHGAPEGDCFVPFGDALVGVMHGEATPTHVSTRLINLSDEAGIEHMGLCWNNHAPWYDHRRREWDYEGRQWQIRTFGRRRSKTPATNR